MVLVELEGFVVSFFVKLVNVNLHVRLLLQNVAQQTVSIGVDDDLDGVVIEHVDVSLHDQDFVPQLPI